MMAEMNVFAKALPRNSTRESLPGLTSFQMTLQPLEHSRNFSSRMKLSEETLLLKTSQ